MARKKTVVKQEEGKPHLPNTETLTKGLKLKKINLNEKQKDFLEIALDPECKLIFVKGVAGTAKTYLSVLASLSLLYNKQVNNITYVRTLAESSDYGLGYLPGDFAQKVEPFMGPLTDKLHEFLYESDIQDLYKHGMLTQKIQNHLRGASFNDRAIIFDEYQNATSSDFYLALSRLGRRNKVFVCGDPLQSDINGQSFFSKAYDLFDDEESREAGIYVFEFTDEDVVRSDLVKFLMKKFKNVDLRKRSTKNQKLKK